MANLPKTVTPKREGDFILITMPHYWGRGKDYTEAKAKLKAAGGRPGKYWRIHSVHPETYLNEMGQIVYPTGHEAMMIEESNPE